MTPKTIQRTVDAYGCVNLNKAQYFVSHELVGEAITITEAKGRLTATLKDGTKKRLSRNKGKQKFIIKNSTVSRVLNHNTEPLREGTQQMIIAEVLEELKAIGDKSLRYSGKALEQANRATDVTIKNYSEIETRLIKVNNFQNTLLEHEKEILSLLRNYKWQVRTFLETSATDISILREEIQKIRTTQSHKGFNFFLLNTSNIKAGIRFIKRLLNFRNIFHRIFQAISRSANSTNQSITNPLDNVKGNGAFPRFDEVSETQPAPSPMSKIQNSISNSIHETQNTNQTNGGKVK